MHRAWHLIQHVPPTLDQLRAVFDEVIGSKRCLRGDIARDGEDVPTLLIGQPGSNEGAAVFGRLDDQDTKTEPTEDAVPVGKVLRERRRPEGKLREERARGREDLLGQFLVLRRIGRFEPRSDDGDRPPSGFQGSTMGRRVDATGKARDDRQSAGRQLPRQALRGIDAITRRAARPDYCQTRLTQRLPPSPAQIEDDRRIVNLPEECGIVFIGQDHQVDAERLQTLDLGVGLGQRLSPFQLLDGLPLEASGLELLPRGGQDVRWGSKTIEQLIGQPGADSPDHVQRDPVDKIRPHGGTS